MEPPGATPEPIRRLLAEIERAPMNRLRDADLRARGLEPAALRRWFRTQDFQQRVWTALREIPFGTVRSYGEQARAIGEPNAVRAVARANGDNRIAIVIPCHRVIGADGTLTGYGGGLWRKQWLLEHEGWTSPGRGSATSAQTELLGRLGRPPARAPRVSAATAPARSDARRAPRRPAGRNTRRAVRPWRKALPGRRSGATPDPRSRRRQRRPAP